MLRLGGVEERAETVAAEEVGGGHEVTVEEIRLVDSRIVEEDLETNGVDEDYRLGISGHERPRRDVCSVNGGLMGLHARAEVSFYALVVMKVISILNRPEKRQTITTWDFSQREL